MKTEQQYFEEGVSMATYMEQMTAHKEASFQVYNAFEIPSGDEFTEELAAKNVHILAITEDWCGDAMVNNPIMRKMAEAANVEIRTVLRDADPALIDRHLTNGGRSIPIYLFLNEAGEVVSKWGPRAPKLQQIVDEGRAALPEKESEGFEVAQKAFYTNLTERYATESGLWHEVYASIKEAVRKI